MKLLMPLPLAAGLVCAVFVCGPGQTLAQAAAPQTPVTQQPPPAPPFEPTVGQPGKDVVWVPTPAVLVEKMLDMAEVTPADVVMDLGSGDGRNIIAAAKRGARAIGVEYNPDMVTLSQRLAREAGVADRATFIQGDMYAADISASTVMALFLLPNNLEKLRDTFLRLKPGTRLVLNTFGIPDWDADATETVGGDCPSWCTSLLYYVPAPVAGTWTLPQGELLINQQFQVISGTWSADGTTVPIAGKLRGDQISFTAAGVEYAGIVAGDHMSGVATSGGTRREWSALRRR